MIRSLLLILISLTTLQNGISQRKVLCRVSDDLNKVINSNPESTIILEEGLHQTQGVIINSSNLTLIIPSNAVLKLSDEAVLNDKAFGGISNAVIKVEGEISNPVKNVEIRVDGLIDGNRTKHPYSQGGLEGINMIHVANSKIIGKGIVANCNGDGIDLDNINNCLIQDVRLLNNSGSGLHFGSPRPIVGSKNNLVINITSSENGFERKRNGIDLSWPNEYGATFINCISIDNYRNYEIEAAGSVVVNCYSIDNGKVVKKDFFGGAEFALVNDRNITDKSLIRRKTQIILKHRIRKLLGLETNDYLNDLTF